MRKSLLVSVQLFTNLLIFNFWHKSSVCDLYYLNWSLKLYLAILQLTSFEN